MLTPDTQHPTQHVAFSTLGPRQVFDIKHFSNDTNNAVYNEHVLYWPDIPNCRLISKAMMISLYIRPRVYSYRQFALVM